MILSYVLGTCLVASFGVVALVYMQFQKTKMQALKSEVEKEFLARELLEWQKKHELLSQQKLKIEEDLSLEKQNFAGLKSNLHNLQQKLDEKKQEWVELQEMLKSSFSNMSQKWVEEAGEKLLKTADEKWKSSNAQLDLWFQNKNQSLQEFLSPIKTTLNQVEHSLKTFDQARVANFSKMDEQLQGLMRAYQQLNKETTQLSQALKSTTIRGKWGEIQLKRVVELAGMVSHCDFTEQVQVQNDTAKLRPDMVIHLPKDRVIVVDAKAPLNAFLKAMECEDDIEKKMFLKSHAKEMRAHIQALSSKEYWAGFSDSLEFVVMFLPGENIFSSAYEADPDIFDLGIKSKVIIATPMTLVAMMKAVAYGWNQERAHENTQKIANLGYELYDRMVVFSKYFQDMEKSIYTLIKSYNQTVASFESRVLVSARKFKELGVSSTKDFSPVGTIDDNGAILKNLE